MPSGDLILNIHAATTKAAVSSASGSAPGTPKSRTPSSTLGRAASHALFHRTNSLIKRDSFIYSGGAAESGPAAGRSPPTSDADDTTSTSSSEDGKNKVFPSQEAGAAAGSAGRSRADSPDDISRSDSESKKSRTLLAPAVPPIQTASDEKQVDAAYDFFRPFELYLRIGPKQKQGNGAITKEIVIKNLQDFTKEFFNSKKNIAIIKKLSHTFRQKNGDPNPVLIELIQTLRKEDEAINLDELKKTDPNIANFLSVAEAMEEKGYEQGRKDADLMLSLAIRKFIKDLREAHVKARKAKLDPTEEQRTTYSVYNTDDDSLPKESQNSFLSQAVFIDAWSESAAKFELALYLYTTLQLQSRRIAIDSYPRKQSKDFKNQSEYESYLADFKKQAKDYFDKGIEESQKQIAVQFYQALSSFDWEGLLTIIGLLFAGTAAAIFLRSSLMSTAGGDIIPEEWGEITAEAALALRSICAAASATSNFAVYGTAWYEVLNIYFKNFIAYCYAKTEGFVFNVIGIMKKIMSEEKAEINLSSICYSIYMVALLAATFANPLLWLFLPISLALSIRFNNNFAVNNVPSKMWENVSKLFTRNSTGSEKALSAWWLSLFTAAAAIATGVGIVAFEKIFLLAGISLIGVAAVALWPLLLITLSVVGLGLLLGKPFQNRRLETLRHAVICILLLAAALGFLFLFATIGWQATLVVGAAFVGVFAAKVLFKMLASALVSFPKLVREDIPKILEGRDRSTQIITIALIVILGLFLVASNAVAQGYIAMFGLTAADSGAVLLLDSGMILMLCNIANSFVLGLSSWGNQFVNFIPGMLDSLRFSDYAQAWDGIIKTSPAWGAFFKVVYHLLPVAMVISLAITAVYSISLALESLSGIMSHAISVWKWALGIPGEKSETEIIYPDTKAPKLSVENKIARVVFVAAWAIPVTLLGAGLAPVYLAARLINRLIGYMFTQCQVAEELIASTTNTPQDTAEKAENPKTLWQKLNLLNTTTEDDVLPPSATHFNDTLNTAALKGVTKLGTTIAKHLPPAPSSHPCFSPAAC